MYIPCVQRKSEVQEPQMSVCWSFSIKGHFLIIEKCKEVLKNGWGLVKRNMSQLGKAPSGQI